MNVEIICPLYHAEKYIKKLHQSLRKQMGIEIVKISYILTKGRDNTESILKELGADYKVIEKEQFSHSITREEAAMSSAANIVVFITQDIVIEDNKWLYYLVEGIINEECEASFSRQVSRHKGTEKYTREKNYPEKAYIVSKEDIHKLGLKAFFFSDVSSAIKKDVFVTLNGYDGKDLPTSEDMYIAYKLIMNGYRIKYASESVVYHSHKSSFRQLYQKYYEIGKFFKQNQYLDNYNVNGTGGSLAKYVLKRSIQEKDIKTLIQFMPNMMARFIGMKMGKQAK